MMKLGEIIEPYAAAKGFKSKTDLAMASGVSVSTIYSLWQRPCKVSWIENAAKLAEALDMPLGLIYEERTQGRRKHSQVDPVKHSQKIKQGQSLCWSCQHAVPDLNGHGCEWSRKFMAVKGWEATETLLTTSYKKAIKSYHVFQCPKYEPDPVPEQIGVGAMRIETALVEEQCEHCPMGRL